MTQNEKRNLRIKWKRWLDKIGQYLGVLLVSYDVHKDIGRIVSKNKKIQSPALLHNWTSNNYIHTVYVSIRRLTDKDPRTISLYRLLEDIKKHPKVITRSKYVSGYPEWMRTEGFADRDYNNFANIRDNYISKFKIERQQKNLIKNTIIIKNYTDKWVAHLDLNRKRIKRPLSRDIKKAIQCIDELYCQYNMLLTRGGLRTRKPVIQFDWKEPLRHAWIEEEK